MKGGVAAGQQNFSIVCRTREVLTRSQGHTAGEVVRAAVRRVYVARVGDWDAGRGRRGTHSCGVCPRVFMPSTFVYLCCNGRAPRSRNPFISDSAVLGFSRCARWKLFGMSLSQLSALDGNC